MAWQMKERMMEAEPELGRLIDATPPWIEDPLVRQEEYVLAGARSRMLWDPLARRNPAGKHCAVLYRTSLGSAAPAENHGRVARSSLV